MGTMGKMSAGELIKDKIGSVRKDFFLGRTLPAYYNKRKSRPLNEKKVLFVEYRSETLSDNFALLYEKLRSQTDLQLSFHNLNHALSRHADYAARCRRLLDDMADAKYVFVNDANEVISALDLRPETKVIQLWHASGAFKKWGMSTAAKGFGADAKKLRRHPNYRNLSLVTVSSPEVIWAYAEAMDLKKRKQIIRATGVSRTDVFFDRSRIEKARETLEAHFPEARGKKIVLYAPTYRGRVTAAYSPDALDFGKMRSSLEEKYVFVVNRHPYVRKKDARCDGHFAADLTGVMSSADLMMASDAMITDYSSVIFEYSLMEKPMLFFAFDLDDYDDFRGFYYPYEEMTPGPVLRTTDEVTAALRKMEDGFDIERVRSFKKKFMGSCDGRSTDRIWETVRKL